MLSDGTDLQAPSNYANRADRHSQLEAFKCQLERFRLQATLEVQWNTPYKDLGASAEINPYKAIYPYTG